MATDHPSQRLDDTVHQRVRLGVLALLAAAERETFLEIQRKLGGNEGALSRHLRVLEDAGHVHIEKGYEGRRPRTWVSITDQGRAALDAHVQTLRELMSRVDARPTEQSVLAAVYAMAALVEKEDSVEQHVTPIGLAHVVLSDVPEGFQIVGDAPINRFYEWPFLPNVNNRFGGGYRKAQQDFVRLGLRAGYWRNWVRDGTTKTGISIQVLEMSDAEAPRTYVRAHEDATDEPIADLGDDAVGFVQDLGDDVFNAWTWFAVGTLIGGVIVWGAREDVEELARVLVGEQRERMAGAVLEPA